MSYAVPPRLGYSELVGTYAPDSPEWHAQRTSGIGGSEIASVAQIEGAFTGRYKLWQIKAGIITEVHSPRTKRMFRNGHLLEPAVAEDFAEAHPEYEVLPTGSWRRFDKTWALSNPDRLYIDRETGEIHVLEIKTSNRGYGFDDDMPPAKYVAQVRWYAGNLALRESRLAVQIGLGDYEEWIIPTASHEPVIHVATGKAEWFGSVYYEGMLEKAEAFMQLLFTNTPPPLDGSEDTLNSVRESHLVVDQDVKTEIPLSLARRYAYADGQVKLWLDRHRQTKAEILQLMGDAKEACVGGVKVAYRQANGHYTPSLYLARSREAREIFTEAVEQPQAA